MARRQMPKNEEEYKRYKEEREARGLASLDSPAETPYGAPTERANLRNPYSGFGNTSLTMPKNEEEYRRYRLRKAAEQNNQKWDARSDLRNQRAELENAAPTATGNMDAEWAGYYAALRNYGAAYGDKASYDEGFAGYNAAMDRVRGQYDSHEARHAESDRKVEERIARTSGMQGAGNRMADADRRSIRDKALYNRMAKDANTAGDYALYQRAAQGYNKTVSDYATNYSQAQSDYWDAAKTEQPGYYYAQTMSADEVDKKLEELYAIKEKLGQNQTRVYFDMDENPHTQKELQNLRATQARISERWNEIETEIAYYEAAQKMQKQQRGDEMYNYWLNEGGLEQPENYAKVEQGKAKYEADQLTASGGMKEPEIATPAGGAIKAYRDRNQKENEWDSIFDNAPNLTPSDEMVFYALYADDPEQAMEWAYYINNRRNSEFQGEMAAWGKEHPITAWFGGLGNRMISGVANIVDQNSAFAQKQSLQSTGLMSGGAQALNEWSGTIDTDIPIIRDLFNGKGAGDFYQLASSIVESGINMAVASYTGDAAKLVGALGTFIMGSSAAAADYNESLQRGLTTAQAQRHALAAGINEAAFEFISLDKVIKADKLAGQLKKVFVDAGIEASEEFCTTVANRVADGYLARQDGYDTQIEQRTKELIALGLSRAEAEAQAEREWRVELINDAIGGFISGGFHAGIEWVGGKVANKIATNQYNETAGIMTDADEIAALRAYADENGIAYNEKALRGMEDTDSSTSLRSAQNDNVENAENSGRQGADSTETRDADSSPTAQNDNGEATDKKQSRREARQERKSNRATGALQTQVEANLAKTLHESGLNNVQAFFEQTVSRYGEGITRTAQNAVAHEARSVFGQASSQAELTDLYQKALEGVTAQPVKQAIKEGYQTATTLRAYRGDNEALRDALVGPGNGGKLNLEAEITGKDGSTQQVRIASLDAERGKVKLDNGETVALNELQGLDADTKDVIERLDRFDLGDTRALAFHSYLLAAAKGDVTDGVRFVMEYALAYDQGRNGVVSLEKATEQSSLPADIVKEAYEHGARQTETWRKDQERRNAEKRAKAKDGATGRKGILDSSRISQQTLDKLSADKKDALRTFELLAEASGVDIRLIAQNADEMGNVRGYQGLYNKDGNYIEIDINAGLNNIFKDLHTGMTAVLGHELTHWMQENAPTEYLAYKKAVLKAIMSTKNGQLRLERMIEAQINQNKREGKEISRSQAEDEIVADASMKRLGDSEFWDAVADNLGEKKADVFAKIKEYISQFFNRVREIIGRASHTSEAAKLIDRVEADVQATLRRLYAEGIGAAMRNSAQIVRDAETLGASEQMLEDATVQYSSRIDDETLHFLDNQEHVTVYRAMQVIDGKLYPPMAAKVEGKLVEPTEIGKWYQSIERPDLVKNGKFTLNKGNGTSVPAAYNPYFHCSASPLNDQFSSAYKRPNLVVVEGIIPKSELTSGYRAEGAKNSVGETTWHAGPVASKLKGNKARRVFLSRWFQVQRIMTDAEVASIVAKTLEGENVSVPSNVVTPGLLEALRSEGVQVDETGIQRQSRKNAATESGKQSDKILSTRADTAYLDAVERGDMETAQRMVDEAAKEAGYNIKAYHGTPKKFNVFSKDRIGSTTDYGWFGKGFYFTDKQDVASVYAGYLNDSNVIEAYLNVQNPFDFNEYPGAEDKTAGQIMEEVMGKKYGRRGELTEDDKAQRSEDFTNWLRENRYDGVRAWSQIMILDSEQAKRTDPVTYDDSGNVIPLSERFNPEKEDIRYSERDYETTSDFDLLLNAAEEISEGGGEDYWASLLESDPGIVGEAEEIKRLGKQLKKTEADLAEARRNLTLTDRKLKTRGIASLAATIMQDQKAGDVNHNDVQKQITAVLTESYQKALDQLDAGADVSDAWETVYQEGVVKAADILLTDATHSEKISYKWYTKTLGEYLGEGAREYVEADIAARVAQDFDANRYRPGQKGTVADRLVAQAENRVSKKLDAAKTENAALKAENAKLSEDKAFYKEQAETAKSTAGELYQQLLDKREELKSNKKISADERKAALKKLDNMTRQMQAKRREAEVWKSKSEIGWKAANKAVQEKQAAVDKLEKQLQREQDILSGKLKPPAIQKMLKAAREREAERVAQQKDERFAKYKEGKKASDLRKRIKNLSDDMKRTMVKPTDGSYVPASLYGSMTKLADALDDFLAPNDGTKAASRYRAVMDKIHALSSEYQAVATLDDPVYSSEYDEEIQHEINELVRTLQGANADEVGTINMTPAKARELSVDELQKVYDIMKYINYCMKTAKSMMASGTFRSVYVAMDAVAKQQREIKPLNEIGKHEAGKRERILNKLSTMRAVEMMSGWNRESALYQLMRGIEQGTMDANAWVMFYDKTMQPLKNGKNELEYRQAVSKKMDYGATDERGNKVLMTKMQALQILMTAEREAHNDKLVHLQRGGAVIRDLKAKRNYRINVTPDLLQKIQNSLTEWDKSYMKTVRDYFQREGKRTNEILYKLRHRVLQTEEYYMPYYVDKDYLETKLDKPEAAMQMWAKVPGSVNALAKNASQPVYIDGMDTVMNQHVKEISNYIGLALAIRDFAKVYNGMIRQGDGEKPLPVKQTINDNFESGSKLLTQAVIDVQGGRKPKEHRTQLGKTLEKLQSAFYRKSLLINMGVTIKQAASYVAAESILDHRAIIAGNRPVFVGADKSHSPSLIAHLFMTPSGKTAQRIFNEIDEHTPLHWQRRQGMSMQELAEASASDGAIKSKLGMLGARMEQSKIGHAARMVTESLDPLNWIQRMDVATTAALWVACKEQATLDGMKAGTAEYWNHVTELYERVITETQPMYDTLHRSEDQKDRNGLMQYLFPFRTVPIQNHGQLVASYETMLAARKSGDKARIEAATRFARKTAVAQAMSAAIFATFTLFAQAMKRKTKKYRDEDEELTLGSLGLGVSKDVIGTLFSVFFPMYGSMVWDSVNTGIDYAKTGKNAFSYNSFSIGVVDMLNDIQKNGSDLAKDMIDLFAGRDVDKDKTISHIGKLVTSGLECFGVPVSTAVSYWNGIKGNVEDLSNGRIPALNDASWERSEAVNARRFIKALESGDEAKAEAVMEEMRQNILKEKPNLKADKVNAKIQSAVQSYVKQQYLDNEMSEEKAIHYMVEYGSADDENDAFWKIREWEAREAWDGEADDFSFSKYTTLREIIDNVGDISEEMQYLQDHGVKFEDANKEIKGYIGKQLKAGEYDEDEAMKTLQAYHKVKDENTKQYRPDTEDEAWLAVKEWKANAEHADDEDYSWNKYEDLFAAMDKGGDIEPHADELESHGIKTDSIKNAVVDHVKERYEAGEVNASEAMRLLQKYRGMDANEAYWKVDEWDAKEEAEANGEKTTNSNYRDLYAAIDANADASAAINELTAHGYKERDVYSAAKDHLVERFEKGEINETQFKNQLSRYAKIVKQEDVDPIVNNAKCYKETGYRLGSLNESYLDGEITAEKFKQIRVKYGGKTAEEAKKQIRWLDLKKANPNLEITESVSNNWYDGTTKSRENGHESAKASGMSIEAYLKAKATLDAIKDSNDNGTGEDEIIAAIAKMNITARQKDALYYERYKGGARKGIYKTW